MVVLCAAAEWSRQINGGSAKGNRAASREGRTFMFGVGANVGVIVNHLCKTTLRGFSKVVHYCCCCTADLGIRRKGAKHFVSYLSILRGSTAT